MIAQGLKVCPRVGQGMRMQVLDRSAIIDIDRRNCALATPLERERIFDDAGQVSYLMLLSFDDWAWARQASGKCQKNRNRSFADEMAEALAMRGGFGISQVCGLPNVDKDTARFRY